MEPRVRQSFSGGIPARRRAAPMLGRKEDNASDHKSFVTLPSLWLCLFSRLGIASSTVHASMRVVTLHVLIWHFQLGQSYSTRAIAKSAVGVCISSLKPSRSPSYHPCVCVPLRPPAPSACARFRACSPARDLAWQAVRLPSHLHARAQARRHVCTDAHVRTHGCKFWAFMCARAWTHACTSCASQHSGFTSDVIVVQLHVLLWSC